MRESIGIHPDVARQHRKRTHNSHFEGGEEDLIRLVADCFGQGTEGDREGTLLVPVSPEGFFSHVQAGPFYSHQTSKMLADEAIVVLWRRNVLEDPESVPAECVWVIVSIRATTSKSRKLARKHCPIQHCPQ